MNTPHIDSFIIKIRVEESDGRSEGLAWHGYVTHVPDGAQSYLGSLNEIAAFVAEYLEDAGVVLNPYWRLRQRMLRRGRAKQET
jgi:hypothetical protein